MHSSLTITDSVYGVLAPDDVAARIEGLEMARGQDAGDILAKIQKLIERARGKKDGRHSWLSHSYQIMTAFCWGERFEPPTT